MSGMEGIGDDDNFSDDGFEDLNDSALYELEQNAILSTQQVQQSQQQPGPRLSRSGTQQAPRPKPLHLLRAAQQVRPPRIAFLQQLHGSNQRPLQPATSFDEQDVDETSLPTPTEEKVSLISPDGSDDIEQGEQFRVQRFAPANARSVQHKPRNYQQPLQARQLGSGFQNQGSQMTHGDPMLLDSNPAFTEKAENGGLAEALRAEIEELRRERDRLTKDLYAANSELQTQKGEIAIVRANQIKAAKAYDRQLTALQSAADEEATRYKAEAEKAKRDIERVATENQFLQQDLTEETRKGKGLQQYLRNKPKDNQTNSPISTPKKTKSLPHRDVFDGFDSEDIRMKSPSKAAKSKKGTPTAGNKRKRQPLNDSPVGPLTLSPGLQTDSDQIETMREGVPGPISLSKKRVLNAPGAEGLRFLQQMYSFRPLGGKETLLEALTHYACPSEPGMKFSTVVVEGSTTFRGANLSLQFAKLIVTLWSRSLEEKYYAPIPVFMDVMRFVLALDSPKVAPGLILDFVPVLQASGKINGIPRFEHSIVSRSSLGKSKVTPRSSLTPEVNATDCLQMLLDIAHACLHNEEDVTLFWSTMNTEFIFVMLNSSQPIADMVLNLNLLFTSLREDTFGVLSSEKPQAEIEMHIIDRAACLLWETPRVDEDEKPYTADEISEFRLEVMSLLSALVFSGAGLNTSTGSYGSRLLAQHPSAIGRLVRFIYDEMSALYSPEPNREYHSTLVNEGIRLFHHLLEVHGKDINLHQKLEAVNGGIQKHAVVLTRLAFRDGPVMEEGIDDETCAMAHDMLEQIITPEEAEGLLEVFPTQKSRR